MNDDLHKMLKSKVTLRSLKPFVWAGVVAAGIHAGLVTWIVYMMAHLQVPENVNCVDVPWSKLIARAGSQGIQKCRCLDGSYFVFMIRNSDNDQFTLYDVSRQYLPLLLNSFLIFAISILDVMKESKWKALTVLPATAMGLIGVGWGTLYLLLDFFQAIM